MRTVGFGLVGYGSFGAIHARAIRDTDQARLVAVGARSADTARRASAELGVEAYTDYAEFLASPDLEVVVVATPSNLHTPMARQAVAAGKHVLVEKPLALSVVECDELLRSAASAGCLVFVDHELRHSPLWRQVREDVAGGTIGQPLSADISLWRGPYRRGSQGWRYDPAQVGNWVYEEPIHFFDVLRWLLGSNPTRVVSSGCSVNGTRTDLVVTFGAHFDFGGARFGTFRQTLNATGHHLRCEVVGTHGALRCEWRGVDDRAKAPEISLEVWDGHSLSRPAVPVTPGESYEVERQIRHVAEAVLDGHTEDGSADAGRWAVAMCEAATAALRDGTMTAVPDPAGAVAGSDIGRAGAEAVGRIDG